MRDFETTVAQDETMLMFRRMASEYPQYNITTFMPLWLFCDQYIAILPHTLEVRACIFVLSTCTSRVRAERVHWYLVRGGHIRDADSATNVRAVGGIIYTQYRRRCYRVCARTSSVYACIGI
jgi:hypothetical protein